MLAFLSQGGGRRIIGVTVGAAILVWIQAQQTLKRAAACRSPASPSSACWRRMQFMLNIRNVGYEEFAFRGESEYDYLHVDDNFLRLAQVIQIVPAEHPHVGFQQLWFTLVRPVPRVFWPGKPIDAGFDLPSDRRTERRQPVDVDHRRVVFELRLARGGLRRLAARPAGPDASTCFASDEEFRTNPIVYGLAVMVLVAGHALDAGPGHHELRAGRVVGWRTG